MKALSIKQPWVGLIACGQKTIETRTWRTSYRGPLLLCSGLRVDKSVVFKQVDLSKLEYGMAIASADLVDCRPMTTEDEDAAKCEWWPNLYAWVLQNIARVESPWSVKGQRGLFEVVNPYSRDGGRHGV